MRLALAVIALPACASAPCDPVHLDDAPDAPAGEIRHGVRLEAGLNTSATPAADAVTCTLCEAIFVFDPALRQQRRLEPLRVGPAAVIGDTTFVVYRDFGKTPTPDDQTSRPRSFRLFALTAYGTERWRDDFASRDPSAFLPEAMIAGPASIVLHDGDRAIVFDPATGAMRWSIPRGSADALAPDAAGGLLVGGGGFAFGTDTVHTALRHLDAAGAETWTRSWTATESRPGYQPKVHVDHAARTPAGGFVLAGEFSGPTLDLGDRILRGPRSTGNTFVIAIDGGGATRWAVAMAGADHVLPMKIAAVTDDAVVICGTYAGDGGTGLGLPAVAADNFEAFVGRVDASGAFTAHAMGGKGYQSCDAIAAASDGSALIGVTSSAFGGGSAVMHVGSRTFDDGENDQHYVLNILP
jgi:hypothetical protein